ncbi:c-type cytochrome [[Phormidium] sp. ETS-05]|uniref:c-type cytochrome n=1 Tax=[Phormidium] sp. ETS-05 TaxID=222819 RepID=UPI001E410215|nr:c-type cytochrome [[Phormidium] sp. ETS-05]
MIGGISPVWAADMANGAKVFTVQCAGCHVNGGNIVRRGKNLYKKALLRNQMDSIAAISALVAQGKYAMPAFHDRLTPQQIEDVAAYVLAQAENNWK